MSRNEWLRPCAAAVIASPASVFAQPMAHAATFDSTTATIADTAGVAGEAIGH